MNVCFFVLRFLIFTWTFSDLSTEHQLPVSAVDGSCFHGSVPAGSWFPYRTVYICSFDQSWTAHALLVSFLIWFLCCVSVRTVPTVNLLTKAQYMRRYMPLSYPDDSRSLFHASTVVFSVFGSCSSFPLSLAVSLTPQYSTVYLLSPCLSRVTVCSAASKLVCHQSYAKIFGCEHRNAGLIQLRMEARQRKAVFTPASWIFTEDGSVHVWSETLHVNHSWLFLYHILTFVGAEEQKSPD